MNGRILTNADLQVIMDNGAAWVQNSWSKLGILDSGESGTLAADTNGFINALIGITTPALRSDFQSHLIARPTAFRAEQALRIKPLFSDLETRLFANLPKGWLFAAAGAFRLIDNWLLRLNGTAAPVVGTPTAGALTAVNIAGGALPSVVSGSCPRVVHTYFGLSRWMETVPSAEATQVAIAGTSNALRYRITSVPNGVKGVGVYRSLFAAGGAPYRWDQDVACVGGETNFDIYVKQADINLRDDITPPSWLSLIAHPQFALLVAIANGLTNSGVFHYSASGLLTPKNVAAAPITEVLGYKNPASSATFASLTVTGAGTNTHVNGTLTIASDTAANIQGFGGTKQLRARVVTTPLDDVGLTITIDYDYYDLAHGWGVVQTVTGIAVGAFSGTGLGATADFPSVAGRFIVAARVTATGGPTTAGGIIIEGKDIRTLPTLS